MKKSLIPILLFVLVGCSTAPKDKSNTRFHVNEVDSTSTSADTTRVDGIPEQKNFLDFN